MAIHLIVQSCPESWPERQAEYAYCLRQNLANPHVTAVHDLADADAAVAEDIASHPKYRRTVLGRWMTYRDAFDHASTHLAGQIVAVANLDIFLDPQSPWDAVGPLVDRGIVLCQSRLEFDPAGPAIKDPGLNRWAFANSQDAWVIRAPIRVPDCDFRIGTLGCDNAIADRIRRSGLTPVNMADRFRIFHFDRARGKTSANQNQVHAAERSPSAERPHLAGQYMLPNIDQVRSVDELLKAFNASEIDRYRVICEVVSRFLRVG